MKNILSKYLKFFIYLNCFLLIFQNHSYAENLENVLQSIERIENDIKDLQKEIYGNKKTGSENISNNNDNNFTVFDIRIRDIENQISQLTSYVEEYVFLIEELNEKINDLLILQSQNALTQNGENLNNESQDSFTNNEEQTLGSLSISGDNISNNIDAEYEDSILPDASPEEQYQFAFDLLRSQQLEKAKNALEEFIEINDDHSLAGSAYYWIGEIMYLEQEYKEAALKFAEAYQNYPDSIKVPDMLLRLSKSLSKIDKTEQSCITLKELISKYPESRLIKKAEMELQILNCQ